MPDDIRIPSLKDSLGARAPVSGGYRARRAGPGRLPVRLMAGVAGGVLLVGVAGWAMMGRRPAVIPVIEADASPIRVKPENPGGMQIAGAEEVDTGAGDKMAPPAEAPAPQALRAQMQQSAPADAPAVAAGAPVAQAPGSQVPGSQVPGSQVLGTQALGAQAGAAVGTGGQVLAGAVPPPRRGAIAGSPPPGMAQVASGISPLPDTPARAVPGRPVVAAAPGKPAAGGATVVQLGALASEAAARAEWDRLGHSLPDVLNGHQPMVERTERDGRTLWRLRTGGFADVADATGFCAKLRAKGGACTIASF